MTFDTESSIDSETVPEHTWFMTTQATTAHKHNGKIVKGLWDCSRCGANVQWLTDDSGQMVLFNVMYRMDGTGNVTPYDKHVCPQDSFRQEAAQTTADALAACTGSRQVTVTDGPVVAVSKPVCRKAL